MSAFDLIDRLLHDQRVPLVEKNRLQRVQTDLFGNSVDLDRIRSRAVKPGWIVEQEGPSS